MADETNIGGAMPTLEDWQHWTLVMGRAQQMLMEFWAEGLKKDQPFPTWSPPAFGFGEAQGASGATDPMALMSAGAQAWAKGRGGAGGGEGARDLGQDARRRDCAAAGRRESAQGPPLRSAGMAREP